MDQNYWGLLKFQTGVTQAAGEKYSIEQRHNSWREYYYIYEKEGIIKGDKEYKKKSGKDPMKQRAGITF